MPERRQRWRSKRRKNFDVDDGDKEGATTRVVVKTTATSILMAVKEWRDEEKMKFYHSN